MLYWPRVIGSKERNTSTGRHNNDFIELEVKTAIWSLRFFMPLDQQVRTGLPMLVGVIDSDYQEKTGLLPNGGKEKCVWNTENPFSAC